MLPYFDGPRPLAFAHRGGALVWPENTLVAFRGALELGYRHIETDMHLTRDGAVVLFHDDRLERTTNGYGPLAAWSLAELQELDAAYRFSPSGTGYPYRGKGVRVPTLEEALALSPDLRLNVEIKSKDPRAVEALWARIQRTGAHDRVLVASADGSVGRAFRRLARGRVATSAGFDEVLAFWSATRLGAGHWTRPGYHALQVPERWRGLRVVDRRFLDAAHRRQLQVHVWTVDEIPVMNRLAALGVDGLMTDRPDLLDPTTGTPRPI
ncbi:MAG: glycerophosphodiester phosphodiesterase [Myxococcota bacterium]